jgi:hypothetical protein
MKRHISLFNPYVTVDALFVQEFDCHIQVAGKTGNMKRGFSSPVSAVQWW